MVPEPFGPDIAYGDEALGDFPARGAVLKGEGAPLSRGGNFDGAFCVSSIWTGPACVC